MALELTNTGSTALSAEEAQHTYFSVGDVRQVLIRGLDSAPYSDRADPTGIKHQQGDLAITTFIDRPFVDTTAPITLVDPSKKRRIIVTREGSRCALVWNPWSTNAPRLPDFGADEWPQMLCIETCNFYDKAITVQPGQTHTMSTQLKIENEK
jgi:D-hexose-6-phosphate mutarotase